MVRTRTPFEIVLNSLKPLCRRRELNPHPFRDTILSRARLPIPPLRHTSFKFRRSKMKPHFILPTNSATEACVLLVINKSLAVWEVMHNH